MIAKLQDAKRSLDVLSTGDTGRCSPSRPLGRKVRQGPFLVDNTRLGALQARSLNEGALWQQSYGPLWDVSGRGKFACEDPLDMSLMTGEGATTPIGPSLRLLVRCRKCASCRKARSAFWKNRAIAEIERSPRSWFVTLTVSPEHRVKAVYSAGRGLHQAGITNPCEETLFAARLKALQPEVTKALKRLRKAAPFRYFLVWEAHQDGFPHAHILLHEKKLGDVTARRIKACWRLGFVDVKVVDQTTREGSHKPAAYVCKYISKGALTRIRSSLHYGNMPGRTA